MEIISSRQNSLVKSVVQLHQTKHRARTKQFVAEGLRVYKALVNAGIVPVSIFLSNKMQQRHPELTKQTNAMLVTDEVMGKMSTSSTPSGLLAVFPMPAPSQQPLAPGLVLARVSDPGNMGTLIRSATAMGARTVVVVEGADPWSPKAIQASAGAIGHVELHQLSWQELSNQKHPPLCALVIQGGKKPDEIALSNQLLVVGSEAHGIPDEWLETCDERLSLPMCTGVGSLNAAVAGSIALFLARSCQ